MADMTVNESAKAAPPTDDSTLLSTDLLIEIHPRWCVRFYGATAQLIAEGLMPKKFEWPDRNHEKHFKNALFECSIARHRPPNAKGPMSTWVTGDYWRLERHLVNRDSHESNVYEKTQELKAVMLRDTDAGRKQGNRWLAAQQDATLQAFKTLVRDAARKGSKRSAA